MKKAVYITGLLSSLFIQPGYSQKIRTLFYDDILYGKVKQVSEAYYLSGTMGVELTDTTWYDDKGNTLENHRRTRHGTLFKEKYTISNEASGKKMQIIGSEHDQNLSAKFDAKGNLAEYYSHFKNGSLNFKSLYDYDQKNNLVVFRNFDKNNILTQKRTYNYDNDDQLIALDNWGENGKLEYHTDFQYLGVDKTGNWTKRIGRNKLQSGKTEELTIIRQITYY